MVLVGIGYTGLGSTTQVLYLPLIPPSLPVGIYYSPTHGHRDSNTTEVDMVRETGILMSTGSPYVTYS